MLRARPGYIFHDLRRTGAREFRRAGTSEGEIMKLGGWSTAEVFRRYDITNGEDTARAVARRFSPATTTGPVINEYRTADAK